MNQTVVAVRGGGDIGTGVALRLFRCGFKVIVLEASQPTVSGAKSLLPKLFIREELKLKELLLF